MTEMSQ